MNTKTRPGGDHLDDDNYPKDRSSGPELDPQEDLEEHHVRDPPYSFKAFLRPVNRLIPPRD